jgi:hypothetical protein
MDEPPPPASPIERIFAIDSTGFPGSRFVRFASITSPTVLEFEQICLANALLRPCDTELRPQLFTLGDIPGHGMPSVVIALRLAGSLQTGDHVLGKIQGALGPAVRGVLPRSPRPCRSLPSNCTSARWANCCASWRTDGCRYALPAEAAAMPVEIWFTHEARS